MIRLVMKSAFFLGLAAMLLPIVASDETAPRQGGTAASIDLFGVVSGAQAAIVDASGFCERAPSACVAGGELAAFAAERIGEGVALAYGALSRTDEAGVGILATPRIAEMVPATVRDRIVTGAVANPARAATAERHPPAPTRLAMPSLAAAPAKAAALSPPAVLLPLSPPIPRPAPRA